MRASSGLFPDVRRAVHGLGQVWVIRDQGSPDPRPGRQGQSERGISMEAFPRSALTPSQKRGAPSFGFSRPVINSVMKNAGEKQPKPALFLRGPRRPRSCNLGRQGGARDNWRAFPRFGSDPIPKTQSTRFCFSGSPARWSGLLMRSRRGPPSRPDTRFGGPHQAPSSPAVGFLFGGARRVRRGRPAR
jgi:hypothetical protein